MEENNFQDKIIDLLKDMQRQCGVEDLSLEGFLVTPYEEGNELIRVLTGPSWKYGAHILLTITFPYPKSVVRDWLYKGEVVNMDRMVPLVGTPGRN